MFMTSIIYEFVCQSLYDSEFNQNNSLAYDAAMSDLRTRIKAELDKRGWTPTDLANKSGVPQPTIQRFLSKTHGEPRINTIKKIASGFGLTEAQLRGFQDATEGKAESKQPRSESNVEAGPDIRGSCPLISWVQAGAWCDAVDLYAPGDAELWLPCPVTHGPHTYCLRIKGDSMTNTIPGQRSYPEGMIIFVDPDRPITNGCRVVAKLPDCEEATFKEYREDSGRRYLMPLNRQYDKFEIAEDTRLCGVVIFAGWQE